MPRVHRIMRADAGGLPICKDTATGLGARDRDVTVKEGKVGPGGGGMSVVRGLDGLGIRVVQGKFPATMVPARLHARIPGAAGPNNLQLFRFGDGAFESGRIADQLAFVLGDQNHGVIEPAESVALDEFRLHLQQTRSMWSNGEND